MDLELAGGSEPPQTRRPQGHGVGGRGVASCGRGGCGLMLTLLASTTGEPPASSGGREGDGQPYWSVAGGVVCVLSDDGRCVTDGPGDYMNSESCSVIAQRDFLLVSASYDVENDYDWLAVNGVPYPRPRFWRGPDGITLHTGDVLSWHSDSTINRRGWKVCANHAEWTEVRTSYFGSFTFPWYAIPLPILIMAAFFINSTTRKRRRDAIEAELRGPQGRGVALASFPNHQCARAQSMPAAVPQIATGVPTVAAVAAEITIADELQKLAQMHLTGQLDDDQYEEAKGRLLGLPNRWSAHGGSEASILPVQAVAVPVHPPTVVSAVVQAV